MKSYIQTLFALLTLVAFTSCEDVIQVKLDKGSPLITIDAFVNDMRSQQKIRLTYANDYFSASKNNPVTGAVVKIKNTTNGEDFVFTDANNGDYYLNLGTSDTLGRLNNDYQLTVMYDGVTYTATSKVNRTVSIDSLDVRFKEAGPFGGKEGYVFKFLAFDLPGTTPDLYWIKSFKNGNYLTGGGFNLAYNSAYGDGSDGYPFIPPIAEAITPGGEVFQKYDLCRVEIHSINLPTYNLLLQAQAQITNSGLFATTPENIKTNITSSNDKIKVVGWFCMSAVSVKEKIAQ